MTRQDLHESFWRYVPIGVILTLLAQGIVWIWWMATFAATTNARLDSIEHQQVALQTLPSRMAQIETQLIMTNQLLAELRQNEKDEHRTQK